MIISKILPRTAEYLPEQLFGQWGAVELEFRVISGSREVFCSAWLNGEVEISKVKGSPIDAEVLQKILLQDEKFNSFIYQQLESLEQFLLTENAMEFYFSKISLLPEEFYHR